MTRVRVAPGFAIALTLSLAFWAFIGWVAAR